MKSVCHLHPLSTHFYESWLQSPFVQNVLLGVSDINTVLWKTEWPPQPVECQTISASPPRPLKDSLRDRECDWEALSRPNVL